MENKKFHKEARDIIETSLTSDLKSWGFPEWRSKNIVKSFLQEDLSKCFKPIMVYDLWIGKVGLHSPTFQDSMNYMRSKLADKCRPAIIELNRHSSPYHHFPFISDESREQYMKGVVPEDSLFCGIDTFERWKEFFIQCLEKRADFSEAFVKEMKIPTTDINPYGKHKSVRNHQEIMGFIGYDQERLIKFSEDMNRPDLVYRFATIALESTFHHPTTLEKAVEIAPRIHKERELVDHIKEIIGMNRLLGRCRVEDTKGLIKITFGHEAYDMTIIDTAKNIEHIVRVDGTERVYHLKY